MYTEELPSDLESTVVLDLLRFASVYHIQDLVDHCNDLLTSMLVKSPTIKEIPATVASISLEAVEAEENGTSNARQTQDLAMAVPGKEHALEYVLPIYEQAVQLCEAKLKRIAQNFVKK